MTQLLVYCDDARARIGTTYDPNLLSKFDQHKAVETWQVGFVSGKLAFRLKTISALNELLRRALDKDLLEVTYQRRLYGRVFEVKETLVVNLIGHNVPPLLTPAGSTAFTDPDIVDMLAASWGEYITVIYKLVSCGEAKLSPVDQPVHFAMADCPAVAAL